MLFKFLNKQKEFEEKKKVSKILINTLNIPERQKKLFLESLEILNEKWMNKMYNEISEFIKQIELKELEDISKTNFTNIAWMQKKEAKQKKEELNAFSILLNNV